MPGYISNTHNLCKDRTSMFLFFDLFFYKPLEHLKARMVIFLDCKINKTMNHSRNFLLMGIYFLEHFTGRGPFCFRCLDVNEISLATTGNDLSLIHISEP